MGRSKSNHGKISGELDGLIKGFQEDNLEGVTSIIVGEQTYAIPALIAVFQGYAAIYKKAEEAAAASVKARQDRDHVEKDAINLAHNTRRVLKGMLGTKNPRLKKFSIDPDKDPTPLTAEEEVQKIALAKATRKARGTMGPKQKAQIKGEIPTK